MFPPRIKTLKKIEIHLSLPLTQPKHPWDVLAEKAKQKQFEQQRASMKHSVKKQFSFEKEPANQSNQIVLTHQQLSVDLNMEPEFSEPDALEEGVFLCPKCMCWFTNKKDLNFHKTHWCDR